MMTRISRRVALGEDKQAIGSVECGLVCHQIYHHLLLKRRPPILRQVRWRSLAVILPRLPIDHHMVMME